MRSSPQAEEILQRVRERLGPDATAEMVAAIADQVEQLLPTRNQAAEGGRLPETALESSQADSPAAAASDDRPSRKGARVIISVFGVNHPGILAGVSKILAQYQCDILDISQKLMQEYFTMILIVDLFGIETRLEKLHAALAQLAEELGIKIYLQREDVFQAVNRL